MNRLVRASATLAFLAAFLLAGERSALADEDYNWEDTGLTHLTGLQVKFSGEMTWSATATAPVYAIARRLKWNGTIYANDGYLNEFTYEPIDTVNRRIVFDDTHSVSEYGNFKYVIEIYSGTTLLDDHTTDPVFVTP
jgi:hypothetical protein